MTPPQEEDGAIWLKPEGVPIYMVAEYRSLVNNGRIEVYCPFALKDVVRGLPGSRWDPVEKCWWLPAEPIYAHQVLRGLPPRVRADNSVRVLAEQFEAVRREESAVKKADDLPAIPDSIFPGWNHQRQAYWFAKDKRAVMLAMDMGCGKTKVTIDLIRAGGAKRVLVVCPKSVMPVWVSEVKKHYAGNWRVTVLEKGTSEDKAELLTRRLAGGANEGLDVFVVNYDSAWRDAIAKVILKTEWDVVIADESHRIKAASGVASRFMQKVAKRAKRRIALTGTPLPHSPLDAYAQYRFLDESIFGRSNTVFKRNYAIFGGYGGYEIIGYRNQDDFNARFYSIAYKVGKEVLDLPPVIHTTLEAALSPEAGRLYHAMRNDMIAQVNGGMITASNALVKLLRLQQITGGSIADEEGKSTRVDSSKALAVQDIAEDIAENEPIVIFARFRSDMDAIHKALTKTRTVYELSGRVNELKDWQAASGGEVLVVQIQSGGVGIDLTRAHYCVYYSLGFSLGDFDQSLARTHRPGQERSVNYYHILATVNGSPTIDHQVYQALRDKREVVDAILEEM